MLKSICKKPRQASNDIILYTILYSLLQLEDYALLMGTGLLLVVLFVLMWVTCNLQVKE